MQLKVSAKKIFNTKILHVNIFNVKISQITVPLYRTLSRGSVPHCTKACHNILLYSHTHTHTHDSFVPLSGDASSHDCDAALQKTEVP